MGDVRELIEEHVRIIKSLQADSGLFLAAAKGVDTGYDKAWLRDNFYTSLGLEAVEDWEAVRKMWRALLDLFLRHEDKISWAATNKPYHTYQYIHARYNPETFDEFWEEWGNKQNDAVGCMLFKIGELEKRGIGVVADDNDRRIIQRLVEYLASVEYWHDPDNGVWEEYEEIHASSIGAVVAGLRMIQQVPGITVPDELVARGEEALLKLLPRESISKFTDLALLSLIWPYQVVDDAMASEILKNLEYHLARRMGIIRYKNDRYYNKNADGYSEEAEWTMGFSWLAIIYAMRGDMAKANEYFSRAQNTVCPEGTIPELYYSNSSDYNENNPLGWAESLFVVAAHAVHSSR